MDEAIAGSPEQFDRAERSRTFSLVARGLATGVVLVFAIAACGGQEATESPVDDWLSSKDSTAPSPFGDAVGISSKLGSGPTSEREARSVQAAIADCMTAQGFEYVPFTPDGESDRAADSTGGLSRREYAKRWGFGISTILDVDGRPLPDAPGFGASAANDSDDPNAEIVAGLSPSEREAYDQTLYGALPLDPAINEGGTLPNIDDLGCVGEAVAKSRQAPADELSSLDRAITEITARVDADEDVKRSERRYADCMLEAGFADVRALGDAEKLVNDRLEAIGYVPNALPGSSDGDSTKLDTADLATVQKFELDLASAELPCRAPLDVVRERARVREEKSYVQRNPEVIESIKRALG